MRGKGRKWESIVGWGRESRIGEEKKGGDGEGRWQGRVRQVRG